jgi:hypothetical protein
MKLLTNLNTSRTRIYLLFTYTALFSKYVVDTINSFFLNPTGNADETGYVHHIISSSKFLDVFSESAQPYYIFANLVQFIYDFEPRILLRTTSLIAGILLILFITFYYHFISKLHSIKKSNDIHDYSILIFSVLFMPNVYIGTSDFISAAFCVIGISLLHGSIYHNAKLNPILIAFILALSITSRPTAIAIVGLYYIVYLITIFKKKKLDIKVLISIPLFTILFIAMLNINHIYNEKKIQLDIKEIPKNVGTNWFEMKYIMVYRWNQGEIPRTQNMSSIDVVEYKEREKLIPPKNNIEYILLNPELFLKNLGRMIVVGLYSSLRSMLSLFFLLFIGTYFFLTKRTNSFDIFHINIFYILSLITFCVLGVAIIEYRWMQAPMLISVLYLLLFLKNQTTELRNTIINSYYIIGIIFFVARMIR